MCRLVHASQCIADVRAVAVGIRAVESVVCCCWLCEQGRFCSGRLSGGGVADTDVRLVLSRVRMELLVSSFCDERTCQTFFDCMRSKSSIRCGCSEEMPGWFVMGSDEMSGSLS